MKKIPIILTTGILMSGLSWPVVALEGGDITSVIPNEVIEPALEFRMTNTTGNTIDFKFDGRDRDLRMRKFIIASYEFSKFSQGMVEERLSELGTVTEPSWIRRIRDLTPNLKRNSDVQEGPVWIDNYSQFFGNNPGLFYYAVQIQKGEEEPYWIRGKIDYRLCSYQYSHSIHNVQTCYGRIDEGTQRYVFERREGVIRDEDDKFVTWEDEWAEILQQQLRGIRSDIRSWYGDEGQKQELLNNLQTMRNTSEDASNQAEALATIEEYESILNAKMQKIAVESMIWAVEADVVNWEDDQEKRAEILQKITEMKSSLASVTREREALLVSGALDTYLDNNTNVDSLLARVEQCEANFKTKTDQYDETHKVTEVEKPEDKKEEPEQPEVTDPSDKTPAGSNNGGGAGGWSGSDGKSDDLDTEIEDRLPDDPKMDIEVPDGGLTEVSEVVVEEAMSGAMVEREVAQMDSAEKTEKVTEDVSKNDQRSVLETDIPALNEPDETEKDNRWYMLPVLGLILAVGAVIWWLKRAFQGRKNLKN